jgi:ABC-2 type transport system permease protein
VGGTITKVAMYVPFCSPFVVPFKLLNSDVAVADVAISIAILVVSVVVVGWFSTKLYTSSVLHYGKRMKLKDLYRTKG